MNLKETSTQHDSVSYSLRFDEIWIQGIKNIIGNAEIFKWIVLIPFLIKLKSFKKSINVIHVSPGNKVFHEWNKNCDTIYIHLEGDLAVKKNANMINIKIGDPVWEMWYLDQKKWRTADVISENWAYLLELKRDFLESEELKDFWPIFLKNLKIIRAKRLSNIKESCWECETICGKITKWVCALLGLEENNFLATSDI
ncbi:MAG: hypothetical protein ACD_4C00397G0002 [uncultured bacterium (gcode 4)]|uniref:Cyclic nucleotide-binding domain-containing protein n=1 Tax=uncultured bacterium (gcode 4) TaxID=1234023 RepID=K2FTH5_9BACT|nr:MAG: hypothetical protein ACD_4C00397G0002 [uncultured bacterium (gcode 4)]